MLKTNCVKEVILHVNILTEHCVEQLSVLLYNLFAHGLLLDPSNGRVVEANAYIDHCVYVELPALKHDPLSMPTNSARAVAHPYVEKIANLKHLPCQAKICSTTTTADESPLSIGDDARLVAVYLQKYFSKDLILKQRITMNFSVDPAVVSSLAL